MRFFKYQAIIIFSIYIAGCSVHESQMSQSEFDVPKVYIHQANNIVKAISDDPFWKQFDNPILNQLIDEGLKSNLDIVAARTRIIQLEKLEKQAHSSILPYINIKGSFNEEKLLSSRGESSGSNLRLSLAAGYEVDLWNKLKNQRTSSNLKVLASENDLQTLFLSTASQVSELYYLLIEQNAQLELIDRIIGLYKNNLELIESRYREGLAPSLDVYMARQNILAVKSRKPQYEKNLAITSHALSVLIGRYPDKNIIGSVKNIPIFSFNESVGIPSELLKNRPDIQAAFHRLEAQDKKIAVAVADRFPSMNIMGAIGSGRVDFTDVISGTFWNILLDVIAPIFDGGRREFEVERQQAIFKELLAGYHKVILRAFQEVEDGLIRVNTTKQWISILSQRLEAAKATFRVANDNYFMGLTEYLTVLTSQAAYFEVESQLLSAKRQLISDWIGMKRAVGLEFKLEGS